MDSIRNISFVIITFNEAFTIGRCLDSIIKLHPVNCEVLCIDSGSTDGTREVIQNYQATISQLSLYVINGYANAAIGRNVGIEKATKEYIYFIDGDVEVHVEFIRDALQLMQNGEADAVTGRLTEYQYDAGHETIIKRVEDRFGIKEQKNVRISGGLFMAKRSIVNDVGYFDETLEKNQDIDFVLRLTNKYKMIAICEDMGIHHTVGYGEWNRMTKDFFRSHRYYGKVVWKNITRGNFKNVTALLKRYRGVTFGWGYYSLIVLLFLLDYGPLWLSSLSILLVDMLSGLFKGQNIVYRMYLHYICPIIAVFGLMIPNKNSVSERNVIRII